MRTLTRGVSPKLRLLWWLVCCLSIMMTLAAWFFWGAAILTTGILAQALAGGICAIYLIVTAWIGVTIHTDRAIPWAWAHWAVGNLPALGLIGTLTGMVELFGFSSARGADISDPAAILAGLGLALFPAVAGFVYSEILTLQLRVCGDD